MTQTDLFGHKPNQGELFAEQKRIRRSEIVTAEEVRAKMLLMLEQARNAQTMPWPERKARINEVIFPQMANWLPKEEADQLRFEFAQEIERLKRAA